MQLTLFGFVLDQLRPVPPVETADLTGKTVVIVGANTGIGFETAKHVARMNVGKLILACRNERKGAVAAAEIESATGCKCCDSWQVDLSDFSSVSRFAERFKRECGRLDILIMNAGMLSWHFEETVDGWETSLQVNYLGTALLSLLLLPCLIDTGKKFESTSRLVIVSSEAHYWAHLPEDVKQSSSPIAKLSGPDYRDLSSMRQHYNRTKLLNVLFTRALQDRLGSTTPLTVNAVNPGFCYSGLRRNVRGVINALVVLMETCLARTSEQGSRQLIYAAIGGREREGDLKGAYISGAAACEPSDFVMSEEGKGIQDRLWGETMDILIGKVPQLESIAQAYLE